MLEIVLLILKIAGIIFAAVLGILIVGLCCILFVPVRYRGDFSVADAENGEKEIGAAFRATWLLRLVRVYVSYEEAVRVRIKLLFFTLMDTAKEKKERKEKKKSEKRRKEKEKKKKGTEREEAVQENENGEKEEKQVGDEYDENAEELIEDAGRNKPAEDESGKESEERTEEKTQDSTAEEEPLRKGRKSRSKKKPAPKEKNGIKKRISDMLQTIRDLCDKLRGIKGKAERAKELWNSAHMISGRNLLWKQLSYLLKHTKPRKLEGYLRFGFEDPSTTGYAMAVYGICCSIWRPKLSVEPNFEKQVLDCHVKIKGKIRVWHFLKAAVVLFFSRDVRHVIKDIKEL